MPSRLDTSGRNELCVCVCVYSNIASSTSHIPCDDCKAKGLWAQTADGKWHEVGAGGPQQFPADFIFPCQFLLLILKISYNLTTLLEFRSNLDYLWIAWQSVNYLLPVKD